MLERKYDPTLPYRFVMYGRMSDPKQNKRSPDQQFATINEALRRAAYLWTCLATYRDDGISGRYVRKRHDLQRLLRDVETGRVVIDLIAVDTLERLGRAEEIAELRRKLFVDHGVLVVAADNGFCDPTGVIGKAVGLVEQIRSTENTRIARHNVLRGKKDAARLGRWPGGPPPFGFRLKMVLDPSSSPPLAYNALEPEPRAAAALKRAFARAAETGEGGSRLSRWWNTCPEIPDDFKPVGPHTVGYRLSNPIAVGTLVWGANRTAVVDDTRVIERNPDGPEVLPGFCAPLVDADLFERVQDLRRARSERNRECRRAAAAAATTEKLIAPQSRGLTLKYLLTGLVRCGVCHASLHPSPSGRQSKAGRQYVYYSCPRRHSGACTNARNVPEGPLREAVIARLRARLFPTPTAPGLPPPWLAELTERVRLEVRRGRADAPDRAAAIRQEVRDLQAQTAGWAMSLSNPQLHAEVRADLEARFAQAKGRVRELEQASEAGRALERQLERALDPAEVVAQLHRLSEVLAGHNPTLANLELSRHIDAIVCHPDGRVELRGTYLGVFEGADELLGRGGGPVAEPPPAPGEGGVTPVRSRRRTRLRLPTLTGDDGPGLGGADTALDPARFAGVPETLVWAEPLLVPEKACWVQEHAEAVFQARETTGLSFQKLAEQFGKTRPTVKHAYDLALARRNREGGHDPAAPVEPEPS
jgi:DNA invertase Pin-like site-specific DNA recombinase